MPDEPTRLSKVVAARVPCSRREAEQYIVEGRVRVDGRVVLEPQARVTGESIDIDAGTELQSPAPATFLLHKPAGLATAAAVASLGAPQHWSGDASGVRPLRSHHAHLVALMALPDDVQGLCVFSQDGRIVRKLQEDAALVEQELLADVAGEIAPGGLQRLAGGMVGGGRALPPAHVSWQSEARLRFASKGLPPGRIAWMCAQVGLRLLALRRIRIGRIALAGLPPGQWRYLAPGDRF